LEKQYYRFELIIRVVGSRAEHSARVVSSDLGAELLPGSKSTVMVFVAVTSNFCWKVLGHASMFPRKT
jgi:hypothetical protein